MSEIDEEIAYLRLRAAECRKLAQRTRVHMYRAKWERIVRDLEKRADELESEQEKVARRKASE
jgi:hypothetical protein